MWFPLTGMSYKLPVNHTFYIPHLAVNVATLSAGYIK